MAKTVHKLKEEAALFLGLSKGDERCFSQIYQHYSKRLFPYIENIIRSRSLSEEILQDIFVRLWINRHLLENVEQPTAYLFSMASHTALRYLQRIAREQKLIDKLILDNEQSSNQTEEQLIMRESKMIIEQAVASLPPQRRRIWELSRDEGLSHKQIAEQLNISTSTVNNQLGQAMQYIRLSLENNASTISLSIFILLNYK